MHSHVTLIGSNAAPVALFSPETGTTFVRIFFDNCSNSGLNNKAFPVEGEALGAINNATGVVSFNEPEATSMLKFGGLPAEFVGESPVEMEGGGLLEVKE